MGKKKPNFYAVRVGEVPGIYKTWAECEKQVKGFTGAKHKGFATLQEAVNFIGDPTLAVKRYAEPAAEPCYIKKERKYRYWKLNCVVIFPT